jgi:hypothetical protein
MANTGWTNGYGDGNWFHQGQSGGTSNWSSNVPADSSTALQTVIVSGTVAAGPTISPTDAYVNTANVIYVKQPYLAGAAGIYQDYQLDGQSIDLTAGATLTMQGVALGRPGGTGGLATQNSTISGVAAPSATPAFDTKMSITATGLDTAMFNDVNHNFGFMGASGAGNTLNVAVGVGGNVQNAHALFNYGEINATAGGEVGINLLASTTTGDTVGFYNEGWVLASGGTFVASNIADKPVTANTGTKPDGYIEISNAGEAVLGTVAAKEEVLFNGGVNNTLALSSPGRFAGSVNGFGAGQTIEVQAFSGAANVGTTVVNGVTELVTTNGTTKDIITLAGSLAPFFDASTITQNGTTTEVLTADAKTYTFTGGGTTTSWFNPGNWSGTASPGATIHAGETVTIPTGTASIGGTAVTDNGTISVTGSATALTDTTSLAGSGTIFIDNGAHVTLANTVGNDSSLTVDFGTHGASLTPNVLDVNGNTLGFGGTIVGFGPNDQIILGSSTEKTPLSAADVNLTFNAATGELTVTDTAGGSIVTESLHLTGTFDTTPQNTLYDSVGANGITIQVPCFVEGTRILTSRGEVAVEALAVGDQVITAQNGTTARRPIRWIGHRSIALDRHVDRSLVEPVRIRAGAFGDNKPTRTLAVSPDHAIYVDGVLIEAKYLVNGVSVRRDTKARRVTYYHVELDRHDVLIAEGMTAESYISDGNRCMFANGGGVVALHPNFAAPVAAARCAPLVHRGAVIEAVRATLRDRVIANGFTTTDAPQAALMVDGVAIAPMASAPGLLRFALPDDATAATLHVATATPADTAVCPDDRRQIGVKLVEAAVLAGVRRQKVDLARLSGLFPIDDGTGQWSRGEVKVDLAGITGTSRVLELRYNAAITRWVAPVADRRVIG